MSERSGRADLTFVGPRGTDGVVASLRVRVDTCGGDGIEDCSMRLLRELQAKRPEAILANCELWPHPQWGQGRYIQSAYLSGRTTMAHDVYLFVDGSTRIRVEVECALVDLLSLEESVAAIVFQLRPALVVLR